MPLSCCIITQDEGDRIERCIKAVLKIADEVVIVDSGSKDDTIEKAKSLGAKVYYHAWDGFGPQKRYAEDCAMHDWILNIDADEVITDELAQEIAALMRSAELNFPAYRFRQVTVYPGKDRPRLWADYHNYVRLYDRRQVRFRESRVHDTVDTGKHAVGQLKGIALHYSWRTLEHLRAKLDKYTDLQAKELNKPHWLIMLRLPIEYPFLFFRYYVLRCNFTGGWFGLNVTHKIAVARSKRLLKILSYQRWHDVPISRALTYWARHAWVSLKQTAGLSRRNDRTYYVDRLVRALRSGALPRTYGILATGKNDGAGSQAQAAMSALCFAEAFGLTYVHRPFTLVEHAEGPMHSWARQCEGHFNLGAGAVTREERSDPVVPLDELLMAPEKWPATAIIAAPHYLHYCNQDPEAWERVLPLLRARFWENKPPRPRADFRIALHMRRGDVSAGDKKVARNFTPNAAFLRTLESITDAVSHYASGEVRIELFSQGAPAIFRDFVRFGCELRLDEPTLTTHRELTEADVLIMSKGAFSYTAGVLGEGVTLYDPQKYRPLQNWIVRAPDGSFDRAQFTERLEALLARRNVEALRARTRSKPPASRSAWDLAR
jgi:glycosyltransferase involved in cell wall biosynthesis